MLTISVEESLSLDGPSDATVQIGGKVYQYHVGSGYYALQSHPAVLAAVCEATLRYGISPGTGRTAFTAPPLFEVERKAAQVLEMDRAFYCSSGALANRILLETLQGTYDRIFVDEAAHGSLMELAKMKRGSVVFAHRNADDLKTQLDRTLRPRQRPLILTDGVFSATGQIAPLAEYDALLAEYDGAAVLVDDAHGFGILGENGRGTLEHFEYAPVRANRTVQDSFESMDDFTTEPTFFASRRTIRPDTPVRYSFAASLGKAVGGFGGIVPGSESFIQRILESSAMLHVAAPPPAPIAAATCKGLELVFEQPGVRTTLRKNVKTFKTKLNRLGVTADETPIPIVAIQSGSAHNMRRIQRALTQRGFLISYIPHSPGVGPDGALRIVLFASHTPEQLDRLVEVLSNNL